MTISERPLFRRVDLQRYVTSFTQNPSANLWNPTSGTGFVMTTVANGSGATGGTMSGKDFYSSSDGSMKRGRPVMRGTYTYSGLTVGRSYTYTSRFATEKVVRARVFMGDAVSDWAEGKGLSTFTTRSVRFTATATTHTLGLEVEAIEDALGVMVTWQTMNLTRNAWAQENPGAWVMDGLADATNLTFRRGGSRTGVGVKTDVGLMSFTLHNAEDPLSGGTIQPGQVVRAVAQDTIVHPEVGHWEAGPDIITGYEPVVSVPAQQAYSHGFENYSATYVPAQGVFTFGYETTADPNWTGVSIGRNDMTATGNQGHSGNFALFMSDSVGAWKTASYVRTGLEIGRQYEFSAWVAGSNSSSYQAKIGVAGLGETLPLTLTGSYATSAGYQKITYYFTAQATSHTLQLSSYRTGGSTNFTAWDDISLTRSAYENVTNNGLDGWTPASANYLSVSAGYGAHSGTYASNLYSGSSAPIVQAKRTVSGLTPGRSYTFRAFGAPWSAEEATLMLRVTGVGTSVPVYTAAVARAYSEVSYTFTATATSHELVLDNNSGLQDVIWDDISLTRNAYTTGGDPIYGPGPDVWVVDQEEWVETINPVPLFTGRVVDVKSTYPLNKATGKERTSVVVTVADAVNVHGGTMRYGVQIAEGFETFESRINRLASSALAPIQPPVQGAPREVYSF